MDKSSETVSETYDMQKEIVDLERQVESKLMNMVKEMSKVMLVTAITAVAAASVPVTGWATSDETEELSLKEKVLLKLGDAKEATASRTSSIWRGLTDSDYKMEKVEAENELLRIALAEAKEDARKAAIYAGADQAAMVSCVNSLHDYLMALDVKKAGE